MAQNNPFQQQFQELRDKASSKDTVKSYQWYMTQIRRLGLATPKPANVLKSDIGELVTTVRWGDMYLFLYDPKTKAKLKYYDRFPLVIPLQMESGGFLGLNIHYLPMKYRIYFMRKLMARAIYDENEEPYRFRITYEILNASKKLKEFRPCVKKYLFSHMKSKIIQIQPEEWDVAITLPVHQFKKDRPSTVWEDSMEQIRNS